MKEEKAPRRFAGYEPKPLAHMEVMRRRRSGQVSPGREVEESRALAGGELVADEGEDPEMGEPMEGDDTLEVHSADGRASTREASTARSARSSSRTRETSPRALRPGMDDEPLVERESSSTASRRRSASVQSSMASKPGSTTRSASRRSGSMERAGDGPKAGAEVNPFLV